MQPVQGMKVESQQLTATNGSVVGSAEVVVNEEIVEVNLIKNPGFESGKQNWTFNTNGTGKFNIISPGSEGNNASEVMLGKIGSNIQLYQKELTLKPDTHYRLSFAAKSSRGHDGKGSAIKTWFTVYQLWFKTRFQPYQGLADLYD
ncbi:MAG: carbohydrate binding domain-containing protein [Candidatus Methanoperedens sp.]|uniref:carbohydrate binding domain-containing protein n=1 Tax=Candidatus Methanoperedens sp. BLZ2 TaxID=2035255 RepID=UPI0015966D93|nr:carbohydrate binding domain-containing protein [Candidatus Methanoperedens sp. BLZ2]MBZ0173864.1 carbohydrate binding domain-containing protein [Candidatus Methanoperedens nitroreducens]MCX9080133.1 carbohydrate binding domain-containing protein [Candidatus Methanoperedens sp.]MCX9088419.1 carbohydrate binding domain-containing protein [Candidatus Methanoperedens sp.]